MTIMQKRIFFKQAKTVFLLFLIALMVTISRVSPGEFTVERIRGFVCDISGIGKQADIAMVENGDKGETVFIRPADQECHFHLFHRSASSDETQLSSDPGGYQIVYAGVLNSDGVRAVCASDVEHTAKKDGEPDERWVETVSIQCWVGVTGNFKPGVTMVGKDPEYAAWVAEVEAHPEKASTYRVVWIRDFSFQFMNMSDAGRPSTDGTYETTFTLKNQNLVVGKTTKLTDTTVEGSVTIEPWDPTPEEMAALMNAAEDAGQTPPSDPAPSIESTAPVLSMTGSSVAGTIKGQTFKMERAEFKNGVLEIRQGKDFFADAKVKVFLFLKQGEIPEGKRFTVDTETRFGAPHIHAGAKPPDASIPKTDIVMSGYKMTLVFGQRRADKLPGTIELRLPDKYQTILTGDFEAVIK